MAERLVHHRLSDTIIEYIGPTDRIQKTVLDQAALTAVGGTAKMFLFDAGKKGQIILGETRMKDGKAAGVITLEVPHFTPAWIEVGDTLEVTQDDGSVHSSTVSTYTPAAEFDRIVMAAGFAFAASAGNKVVLRTKAIGATVFPVEISADGAALEIGDTVQIETDTVGNFNTFGVTQIQKTTQTEEDANGDIAAALNQRSILVLTGGGSSTPISVGKRISVILAGATAITMNEFGTVVAGADDWGFFGIIPDTLAKLQQGMSLRVEINFDGGAGLKDVTSVVLAVVE